MTSNILSDIPAHMAIIDNNTFIGRAMWRPCCLAQLDHLKELEFPSLTTDDQYLFP